MKNQMRDALITAGLAGLLCGPMLRAQNPRSETADVPFEFQVGDNTMPAGTYAAIEAGAKGVIQLRNQASRKSVMVAAFVQKSGRGGEAKLTFRCYNNHCFLAEIWYADENSGHALPQNSREKEMASSQGPAKATYVAMR